MKGREGRVGMGYSDVLIICFGVIVTLAGGTMTVFHYKRWRIAESERTPNDLTSDLAFHPSQQRRRFQIGMLGALGGLGLIIAGVLFQVNPVGGSVFVCGSIIFIFWAILIALADALSVSVHFNTKHAKEIAEQVKLEAKLTEAMRKNRGKKAESDDKGGKDRKDKKES